MTPSLLVWGTIIHRPIFLKPCHGFLGEGEGWGRNFWSIFRAPHVETWWNMTKMRKYSDLFNDSPLLIRADRAGDWTSTKPSIDSKCTGGELFIVSDRSCEGSISGVSVSCLILLWKGLLFFNNQNYCWMKVSGKNAFGQDPEVGGGSLISWGPDLLFYFISLTDSLRCVLFPDLQFIL